MDDFNIATTPHDALSQPAPEGSQADQTAAALSPSAALASPAVSAVQVTLQPSAPAAPSAAAAPPWASGTSPLPVPAAAPYPVRMSPPAAAPRQTWSPAAAPPRASPLPRPAAAQPRVAVAPPLPPMSPPRVPAAPPPASPLRVPPVRQQWSPPRAVPVPRALKELAAHNAPATAAPPAAPPPPPPTGLRFKGGVSSETAAALQRARAFAVGDFVTVAPDTSPGHNREGGPGSVTAMHADGSYDVKYALGSATMRRVRVEDITKADKSPTAAEAAKRSRRRQPTRRFSELVQEGKNYGEPTDEPPPPKRKATPKKKKVVPPIAVVGAARTSHAKTDPPLAPGLWASKEPIVFNEANPKKGKSGERYDLYKKATTTIEFSLLGGSTSDLRFDLARGYARVLNPAFAPPSPRGRRCGVCAGCLAQDCRQCPFCLDQKRYGGPGKLHRTCARRACEAPITPPPDVKRKAPAEAPKPAKRGRKPAAKVVQAIAASPTVKRAPRSPQKVPDRAGLEARMAADGWTREDKQREGSAHVDKYFVPPNGGKKCRSILEVARAAYPTFIVGPPPSPAAPPRRSSTSPKGSTHVWNQNEPEIDPDTGTAYSPCGVCGGKKGGELLMCDGKNGTCDRTAHTGCLNKEFAPEGDWFCAICRSEAAIAATPKYKKPTKKRKSAAKKATDLARLGPDPHVRFNDAIQVIEFSKKGPRGAPRVRGAPVLDKDPALVEALRASNAAYAAEGGESDEYSEEEDDDDGDGGEWSPEAPSPVVKKKAPVKKTVPPPFIQRFAAGAHVEARWEGEWWPAIVDQVFPDAYEIEWVEEPDVFNRLDLEDVRAARAPPVTSPYFAAPPPPARAALPPPWAAPPPPEPREVPPA